MSRLKRILICIALLVTVWPATAQRPDERALAALSYDSLIGLFDSYSRDSLYATSIARVYIKKARLDQDSTKIARGYQRVAFVSPLRQAVKYLDTTIVFSANSAHPNFPASGYLFKAFYLHELEKYEESLQNALMGYRYAQQRNNVRQQLMALHIIGGVNELWGDYQTALETGFRTYELLFRHREDIPDFSQNYLSSLETIGKCYVRLNKPDSALVYFKKGLETALADNDSISYYAFVSQSGTALYASGDYQRALDSLFKADRIRPYYNNSYLPGFYYHVGSSYYSMGEQQRAMSYFHKIDSIYQQRGVLYPELTRVYDKMIAYYQQQGDRERQLALLKKQVLALRLMDEKRILIKQKTNEDYVIPSLVATKEEQIENLERRNASSRIVIWASLALLICSLGLLAFYFRRQRLYRRRFEKLMKGNGQSDGNAVEGLEEIGIAPDIVKDVLERIEQFERKKGYLDRSLTLNQLAKQLETNSTYLSKIINVKKGQNFSRYISDLRVEHAVKELKENPTFRKYTIKAIAQDCGFKSAESFSKSFYRRHGIYPSYYIKQLRST